MKTRGFLMLSRTHIEPTATFRMTQHRQQICGQFSAFKYFTIKQYKHVLLVLLLVLGLYHLEVLQNYSSELDVKKETIQKHCNTYARTLSGAVMLAQKILHETE